MPKRPQNLRKRGGVWYVRFWIDQREVSRSLGTGNLSEARRLAKEIISAYRHGWRPRTHSVSVAEFSRQWIEQAVSIRRKAGSVRLAEQRMKDWVLPMLGRLPVDDVTMADVRELRRALDRSDLSPQSVHHVLSEVRAMFRYAVKLREIAESPVEPEVFPRIAETAPKALSDDQVEAILRHAGPHRATVVLSLETGLRWGELHRLQWRHVLWDSCELLIEEQKNGKAQYVPLTDAAMAALRELRERTSSVFVVPERSKNAQGWVKSIRLRCGFHWTHHQLRHTCGTRLLRATGNRELVRLMLRHSSHRMTDRYARADREWLRERITGSKPDQTKVGGA